MRGSRHRNFLAYKLAASLADDLHDLVIDWNSFELWSVGIQLVRAADSIGANIAEGLGAKRFRMNAASSSWPARRCARSSTGWS